jgi:MFS family permease
MRAKNRVPFHSLGISQIIAYGLMFYVFAQIKTPLATAAGVTEAEVLYAVSGSLFLQTLLAPVIGGLVDRFSALYVLTWGLLIGAAGMGSLPLIPSINWIWFCMIIVGVGFAMSNYDSAFSAAVQIDEKMARRNISFITFYGGVASSLTWLAVAPLLDHSGLTSTCFFIAGMLLVMAGRTYYLATLSLEKTKREDKRKQERFNWSIMTRVERYAILILGILSSLESLLFAATTLLWISWFNILYDQPGLAVILASIYGPFQVVGRVLEMRFGHKTDARITGIVAFALVPISLLIVQIPHIEASVLAMALFGMGNGVMTVTFGYVTNMYFKAEVYGRAKGWIVMPRGISYAMGPSIGGILFITGQLQFFGVMIILGVVSCAVFMGLLLLKPREGM